MFRFILILLVVLFFGIPLLYEKAFAEETKIVEINGKQWLVVIEPNKLPRFKSLEPEPKEVTKFPFVIHDNSEESSTAIVIEENSKPEWKKTTIKESKLVQTCDGPLGCEMTVEGDCPDCKTEIVREETVEVVQNTDFSEFKADIKNQQKMMEMTQNKKEYSYLSSYLHLRDTGHPAWICFKIFYTCQHGDPILIEDLFVGKMNSSYCTQSINPCPTCFSFSDPLKYCSNSTILNL